MEGHRVKNKPFRVFFKNSNPDTFLEKNLSADSLWELQGFRAKKLNKYLCLELSIEDIRSKAQNSLLHFVFNWLSAKSMSEGNPIPMIEVKEELKEKFIPQVCETQKVQINFGWIPVKNYLPTKNMEVKLKDSNDKEFLGYINQNGKWEPSLGNAFLNQIMFWKRPSIIKTLMYSKQYGWTELHTSFLTVKQCAKFVDLIYEYFRNKETYIPVPEDLIPLLKWLPA